MKYPLVFYVKQLPKRYEKAGFDGVANGPVVRIRKDHKEDKGLYAHEITHVKQWFCTLGLHSFLILIPKYKAWSERQACKAQGKVYRRG